MSVRYTSDRAGDAASQILDWLQESERVIAFTGAGISTDSGIPDFRSPGGVWANNQPVDYREFMRSDDARYEYWRQKAQAHRDFADAKPNRTHLLLAEWEQCARLHGIITQNIDGLHQDAGSQNVLELHGSARTIACQDCSWTGAAEKWVQLFLDTESVPPCPECRGRLKHATVSFGQSLPQDILNAAIAWASTADLMFALGSSLVVEPAASLPRIAAENGARLVILNRDETPLDSLASMIVNVPLSQIVEQLDSDCRH